GHGHAHPGAAIQVPPPSATDLPEPVRLAGPDVLHLPNDRGTAAHTRDRQPEDPREAGAGTPRHGRDARRGDAPLPERTLRWPTPADRHRPGTRARARGSRMR